MLRRFVIGRHERGFLFREQDYLRCLGPGAHWVWGFGRTLRRASTEQVGLVDPKLDVLLRDPALREQLVIADLSDDERAIVWVDGRVHDLLGPGRCAFWSDLHEVKLERVRASELRFAHPLLDPILNTPGGRRELLEVVVPKGSRGLLYVNEKLEDELGPGRYAFWQRVARVSVETLDLREATLEVCGQDVLTADKVTLRVNVTATYRVEDPRRLIETTGDASATLYREVQLALRESIGARKLDALLSAKEEVAQEVRAAVEPRAQALGTALGAVGIRDLILPGEMRTLLNQVIEAEKRAQANLIARREETAATRSLLNTAKLIEQSPTLLRLKELEAAERMAASIESIQIVGGGIEGLVKQLLPRGGAAAG